MIPSRVASLVRAWVDFYTAGANAAARDARRDEIADDLWCQGEEADALGQTSASIGTEMVVRLLLGMPADISWRFPHRGQPAPKPERSSSGGTRLIGALAIIFGVSWATVVILFTTIGPSIWTGSVGYLAVVLSSGGSLVFAVAVAAMIVEFQDRLRIVSGIGGLLAAFGAFLSVTGQLVGIGLLLPVVSTLLIWDLARAGVFSRSLALVHAISGLMLFVLIVIAVTASDTNAAGSEFFALSLPYMLTWIALGVSLLRGVPTAQQTATCGLKGRGR